MYSSSVYVSANGSTSGVGSPENPFSTIEAAINYVIGTGTRLAPQYPTTIVIDGNFSITDSTSVGVNWAIVGVNYVINHTITYNPSDNSTSTERYLFDTNSVPNAAVNVSGNGRISITGSYCGFARIGNNTTGVNHIVNVDVASTSSYLPLVYKGTASTTDEGLAIYKNFQNIMSTGLIYRAEFFYYLNLATFSTTFLRNGNTNTTPLTPKYYPSNISSESNLRIGVMLGAGITRINDTFFFASGCNSFFYIDSTHGGTFDISGRIISGYITQKNTSFLRVAASLTQSSNLGRFTGIWVHDVNFGTGYDDSNVSDVILGDDVIYIDSAVTSIRNFFVNNCSFQSHINSRALGFIGTQSIGTKVPCINLGREYAYFTGFPTATLSDSTNVLVMDSTGVAGVTTIADLVSYIKQS